MNLYGSNILDLYGFGNHQKINWIQKNGFMGMAGWQTRRDELGPQILPWSGPDAPVHMGIDTNENMCSSWRKCAEKFVVARILLCRENSFNAHGRSSVKMKRWQKGQAKGKNLIRWNKHPKHIEKLDKNTDKTERNRLESRWSRKVFLRVLICKPEIEQNKEGRYFSDQRSRICWVVRDNFKYILMEILYRNDSAFDENGYRIGPKVSAQT